MSEWKEVTLNQFVNIKHGYAFSGQGITDEDTGKRLVTPGNFHIGGGFNNSKFKFFKNEHPKEYEFSGGEIVVTMTDLSKETDALGYAAKIPFDKEKKYLHNQRVGLVEFINNNVHKDFIYWLMRTYDYHWFIVGSASGTSIMHTSPSRIGEYNFLLPPLPEQRAIASVLSSLDDKIDLLHRQNKTLEAMAETQFRQVVAPADAGGEEAVEGTILQLITVQNGYAFKSKDFIENGNNGIIKIKNISNGIIDISNTEHIDETVAGKTQHQFKIHTGDILIAMTGAEIGKLGIVPQTGKKLWLNQRVGLLREKFPGAKYLAYLQLKSEFGQDYIDNTATGSAQPNISGTGIEKCGFPIVNENEIIKYSLQIGELYNQVIINLGKIHTLEKLRDTLLPKLISGEVRVEI